MNWLIVLSPFALGALIVGIIKAFDWLCDYRYERARRIRNEKLRLYGLGAFKGTKDRWLS